MSALSDASLAALLEGDVPSGDLTTDSLGIGAHPARLGFFARDAMTVCGTEEAARLFLLSGAAPRVLVSSGRVVEAGAALLEVEGTAGALHRGWKTAQTLVEWASGVATATSAIVRAADGLPVACTRKSAPGTKALAAKAVRAGGAVMHRLGLSETLLVFAEHRLFLSEAPPATVERLHRTQPEKRVVVEVSTVEEGLLWARAGADVLQLERFSLPDVATLRVALGYGPRPRLAVAGGVRADNAAAYVAAGADVLVTSAPYNAPPRDVRVTFQVASPSEAADRGGGGG